MQNNKNHPQAQSEILGNQQGENKTEFKNQNPNQNHNTKKVSLGPNTKR